MEILEDFERFWRILEDSLGFLRMPGASTEIHGDFEGFLRIPGASMEILGDLGGCFGILRDSRRFNGDSWRFFWDSWGFQAVMMTSGDA